MPSSKAFRRWVKDNEDEIDECRLVINVNLNYLFNYFLVTTICGPVGEDEEELGEEFDDDDSSGEDDIYPEQSDDEELVSDDDIHPEHSDDEELFGDDDNKSSDDNEVTSISSDSEAEFLTSIPRSLQLAANLTPIKNNSSFRDKFLSPRLSVSRNESVNLSCLSCGTPTTYTQDLGLGNSSFECDDCLLSVHQDCDEDCQLCKDIASKVSNRWSKRDNAMMKKD